MNRDLVMIRLGQLQSLEKCICNAIEMREDNEDTQKETAIEKSGVAPLLDSTTVWLVVQRQDLGRDILCFRYHPGDYPPKWACYQ